MTTTATNSMLQALAEALPPAFFDTPLDCIFADNFRCRVLCNVLSQIVDGAELDLKSLRVALHFLRIDFVSHLADEEQALFPLLRERAQAADHVEHIWADLRFPPDMLERVVDGLAGLRESRRLHLPRPQFRKLLEKFVETERRHVSIENARLLPLARRRLSQSDLAWLGRAMQSMRQLTHAN